MKRMNAAGKLLPEVNADPEHLLDGIRVFALDMDGTVYLGEKWIDGAVDFLRHIEESGRRFYFLTNNSSKAPASYVKKLTGMGFPVEQDRIVTSGQAAAWYLKVHFPGKRVYLLGNPDLRKEFEEEGILLSDADPEVVVTGFDTTLTYAKLCRVCDLVRAGLPYIATHPDLNCPVEGGFIPDLGAIQALIRTSAFRDPDRIIGKPNRDICDYLMARIGGNISPGSVAMVGDRLYTDIAAGVHAGMTSILVLSGEASLEDAEASSFTPDLIFDSVQNIR
ncbi:MAG: HAD-IIA family hydrolase [Lachnospiraceae bacterium]|jgi:HAD superfamily hydrolase (TIGR01450 family)|nr:HAD-IIA family hydrolase [Lachnospiraceae bacterium]